MVRGNANSLSALACILYCGFVWLLSLRRLDSANDCLWATKLFCSFLQQLYACSYTHLTYYDCEEDSQMAHDLGETVVWLLGVVMQAEQISV